MFLPVSCPGWASGGYRIVVITEGTVKNHVLNLIAKLKVRDRTQPLLKAKVLGII